MTTGIGFLRRLALSAPIALVPAVALPQTTRTYPGPSPCNTTLQACIDGSGPGDTIRIGPGQFNESLTLAKPVSLIGAGTDVDNITVLRADDLGQRVLTITGSAITSSTVISDLLIYRGTTAGYGGGIYVTGGAQPLITDVVISENRALRGGGLAADGSLTLVNVRILYNTAEGAGAGAGLGGGVYVTSTLTITDGYFAGNQGISGGGLWAGSLTATDTQFVANTAFQSGGGAYVEGNAILTRGLVESNQAASQGGGLSVGRFPVPGNDLEANGTEFVGNTAGGDGGGAFVAYAAFLRRARFDSNQSFGAGGGLSAWYLNATDTRFASNHAATDGGGVKIVDAALLGAAVFLGNSATQRGGGLITGAASGIVRAEFIANSAGSGGGLFVRGDADLNSRITNSLFARNMAVDAGAAVYVGDSYNTTSLRHLTITHHAASPQQPPINPKQAIYFSGIGGVSNSIIARHVVGIESGGSGAFEDYNLFSESAQEVVGTVSRGGHSFPGAPAFADPAADDYHLTPASHAINTGTDVGIAEDFELDVRPFGPRSDIGYDEWAVPSNVIFKDGFEDP